MRHRLSRTPFIAVTYAPLMSTARQTLATGGSKQRSLRFDRRFDRHVDFRFGDVEFFGSLRLRTRALRAPNVFALWRGEAPWAGG